MNSASEPPTTANNEDTLNVSIMQVVGSILASFFGVQSSKNRKRDFESGKAGTFIAVGVVMTVICCLALYLAVALVVHSAK